MLREFVPNQYFSDSTRVSQHALTQYRWVGDSGIAGTYGKPIIWVANRGFYTCKNRTLTTWSMKQMQLGSTPLYAHAGINKSTQLCTLLPTSCSRLPLIMFFFFSPFNHLIVGLPPPVNVMVDAISPTMLQVNWDGVSFQSVPLISPHNISPSLTVPSHLRKKALTLQTTGLWSSFVMKLLFAARRSFVMKFLFAMPPLQMHRLPW